ncbi:hypothetical protein BOTBODRAFT_56682 [Botryobasidium botryosum FD-172 SS1]|uniref:Peptidase M20 domain-containing protein 2 n=1 Tax=Botryobasidium botryosum (strain FD-172 SS1) TaxID=930990 RepID=A0A067ML87_BOTB1|nr:hypothetical protein BOTBODRAFT_56682 [Botryobasidium botryosum FD-172 SS1]
MPSARRACAACNFSPTPDRATNFEDWPKEQKPLQALENVFMPEAVQTIEARIDELNSELRELSLKIHGRPELAFEEQYAHDTLTAFMASHGFEVTPHYAELSTAWRAVFSRGSGGHVLGFNSEMDALPGIGHACGHNLIAIAGVGAAIAVKKAMEVHDIDGKIVLLGTPAEEVGEGKVLMIRKEAYEEMDVCMMVHPSPGVANSVGTGSSLALQLLTVEYFGHTAHASAAPWEGQNALDAAFLAYGSISVLRQQLKPTHRVHGVVEGRDWKANIIPDYAKMEWYIRAPTVAELAILRERVKACFEAAALATGCKLKFEAHITVYDIHQNKALIGEFAVYLKNRHSWGEYPEREGAVGGSTDFGNVTYELPSIHPSYAIPTVPNGGNHTTAFRDSAATTEAHEATLTVTKAIAVTGLRILGDAEYLANAKAVHKAWRDLEDIPRA